MTPWQAHHEPKHTLSIKYVKQIMTPKEYKAFIVKYLEAKQKAMVAGMESATGRGK